MSARPPSDRLVTALQRMFAAQSRSYLAPSGNPEHPAIRSSRLRLPSNRYDPEPTVILTSDFDCSQRDHRVVTFAGRTQKGRRNGFGACAAGRRREPWPDYCGVCATRGIARHAPADLARPRRLLSHFSRRCRFMPRMRHGWPIQDRETTVRRPTGALRPCLSAPRLSRARFWGIPPRRAGEARRVTPGACLLLHAFRTPGGGWRACRKADLAMV